MQNIQGSNFPQTGNIGALQGGPQQAPGAPMSDEKMKQLIAQALLARQQNAGAGGSSCGGRGCTGGGGGGGGGGSMAMPTVAGSAPPGISEEDWAAMSPQDKQKLVAALNSGPQGQQMRQSAQQLGGCTCSPSPQRAA